jgi:adenylate cyclase
MNDLFRQFVSWASTVGADPTDDEETKLQKTLLVLATFPFVAAGLGWGLAYISVGAWLAGLDPLVYGIFLLVILVIFATTKNYAFFRFAQLSAMLILPFILMTSLGGFVSGSFAITWSFLAPMGALLLDKPRRSIPWFAGFLVLVIVSGILEPYLDTPVAIPRTMQISFFVLNVGVVGGLVYLMVLYFVSQKNIYQDRSEELLLNILPQKIVALLKEEHKTIADDFDNVSVMFADVVDFTTLSSQVSPTQLVEMLNDVFQVFDRLADTYGLEKIKTIGDCYMVASGVPEPRNDHAHRLIHMALDLQEYVSTHTFRGRSLAFRIGINSGPVVAGVIGMKKFSYDLWGDAVNTASRMESHGSAGIIQISSSTYDLVKEDIHCEPIGVVQVKGKGAMETWRVIGRDEMKKGIFST